MSLAKQWKKLRELQRRVDKATTTEAEMSDVEIARRIGFMLVRGLEEAAYLEVGHRVATILASVPRPTPEQIEAGRKAREKAHLRHGV